LGPPSVPRKGVKSLCTDPTPLCGKGWGAEVALCSDVAFALQEDFYIPLSVPEKRARICVGKRERKKETESRNRIRSLGQD